MKLERLLFLCLVFPLALVGYSFPASAAYQILGIYTSAIAARDACKSHAEFPASNQYCSIESNTLDGSFDVCSLQDIHWHNGSSSYGPPNIWPDRYGFISTENCGASCPPGYTEQPSGECLEDQQCPIGDVQRFHATVGEPIPDNVCSNGCWYEREQDDLPVQFVLPGNAWSGNFTSTGNACAAGGGPGGPPDDPPENCISDAYGNTFCAGFGPGNAPPNCIEDTSGNQACLDAYDPQNCGYLNGEQVCYDDYPDNAECYFIPGGSYICFPGDNEPASPPYPDTGTPGDPAPPDIQMESGAPGGGPGPVDFFDSDTVNQSSGEGGAPGPTSDTTPPDDPTTLDGPIEIDESGTPSGPAPTLYDGLIDGTGVNQLESDINDIGAGTLSPIPDMPSSIADVENILPTPGSCSDPVITFFGHAMTIPIVSKGDGFRDIMGYFFYAMTAFFLFHTIVGLPNKVR